MFTAKGGRGYRDWRLRRAIEYLEAPILRVTGLDTPFPYSLEHEYLPNPERVVGAVQKTLEW